MYVNTFISTKKEGGRKEKMLLCYAILFVYFSIFFMHAL